ncbi:hydantoinase/carbamoylase family amidase [Algihabitans albus]|uniref:hydantoinase/carbamoylase family amidase n=1 Tax=Algihabitans albus TaxID=2164067 RepID=UPI000E5D86B2|nr:hydantoinase/carbamoylase family amidase [Algihabitans albus]
MTTIRIDSERLLADLDKLRTFGRCGTGVVRPAYSEAELDARRWLAERIAEAGLEVAVDPVGNLFGLPPGDDACILIGSHSDSQPEGGWLDGAYGVIAGLEVARASLEADGPRIAVVSFQDEEGRFTTLTGSSVWAGQLTLAQAQRLTDDEGISLAEACRQPEGLPAPADVAPERFRSFLEIHIEQGPVLDTAGERIGVVENIVGIRSERLRFTGQQNHAGTTPMHLRRDPVQGLVRYVNDLNARFAEIVTPATVWTVGHVAVHPNAPSIVPGQVDCTVQWRDADTTRLDRMTEIVRETASEIASSIGLELERSGYATIAPTHCDPALVETLAEAAEAVAPGAWRRMPSGALHDAANASYRMPMAMLFVPSKRGISHSFEEDTERADLVLGVEVLAKAAASL